MARMRKPGWNACEEFKIREKRRISNGSDDATTSIRFAKSLETSTRSGESSVQARRIKTLAQAASSEVPQVKADLKSKLPTLTAVEVRRYRIPYFESVILELEEDGLRDAAEYMSMLFELDEEMRKKTEPGSIVWKKPRLKNQKNFLERLRSGLTTAEMAKKSGKLLTQATSLLDIALFFESQTWEWFWIAEQLYRSSLKIVENVQYDKDQTLNVIRYLYGCSCQTEAKCKQLLYDRIVNDHQEALGYLDEVRVASEGKTWNASKILGVKQETLYRESCTLLHKALLIVAEKAEDPEMSVRAAELALKRAKDSVHDEYIAAALHELGKNQLSSGDIKLALGNLSKFLAIAKRIPDEEGVCNAHMELAFAYKELQDSEGTVKHLALLRECATQYKLPYKLAQAHYYTGEYLLNKSQANLATPHLELALSQFNSLGKTAEANRARCAAGVSKGQEVMDRYIGLILDCEAGVTEATTKICLWKANRVPFWTSMKAEDSTDALSPASDLCRDTEDVNFSKASTSSSLSMSLLTHPSNLEESKEIVVTQKTPEVSFRTKDDSPPTPKSF